MAATKKRAKKTPQVVGSVPATLPRLAKVIGDAKRAAMTRSCSGARAGEARCFDKQKAKQRGYHSYNPDELCGECSVEWYLDMARRSVDIAIAELNLDRAEEKARLERERAVRR